MAQVDDLATEAVARGANQHPRELADLGRWLIEHGRVPSRVLEIGTLYGGTLWFWRALGARAWGVDFDPRYAGRGVLTADSRAPETVARARALAPFDLLHIDGDHRLEAAMEDWHNYHPLVAPGGVVVIHDAASLDWPDVRGHLWPYLVERHEGAHLIHHEGGMGIGVIPLTGDGAGGEAADT